MTVFTWLLFGHLLGDWLFQNDWMAKGKKQGWFTVAGFTHFTIYTVIVMTILWVAVREAGYSTTSLVLSAIIIFVSHWLTDASNIVGGWIQFYGQTDNVLMRIMVDQTLHIIVLALVTVLFFG